MALRKFHLDRQNGKFMGVCSGIANYFGIDATLVRIGVVAITLFGAFPWTLVAYGLAVWLARPRTMETAEMEEVRARVSTNDLRRNMRDIDRRLAEVDTFVTSSNTGLANEIEKLR